MAFDYQRYIDRVDDWIVNRPGRLIVAFLVLTGLFAVGLGNVSTEAGTQQFAEDVPAQEALRDVQREFGPPFESDEGSTQLVQSGSNVLSKPALLGMLRTQKRIAETDGLRVSGTSSAARIVARTIDPDAGTLEEQIRAVERAPPSRIDAAVRTAAVENPRFAGLVSSDFNVRSASASATIGVVTHTVPAGLSTGAGTGGSSPLTSIQLRQERIVRSVDADITVFGTGIFSAEFSNVIFDSLILTVPAAVLFILLFLSVAYRDPLDLLLGLVALVMTVVWTFGFMGLAGIPFNQILIAVPPLLLAIGIDFGIHAINRYREERVLGYDIDTSITNMTDQIVVAFFIVTATTVIGFASNLSSALVPIRDFGVVASVGITFTFLIFGVFLPAAKVALDRFREAHPRVPTVSDTPLGAEGSRLGRTLSVGVGIARRAPTLFLVGVVVLTAASGAYATGIDTSFSQEDFLPPEDIPDAIEALPEPFAPSEYSAIGTLNFLEEKFATAQDDTVTIYVEGPMERDHALEAIHRAGRDPPDSFVSNGRRADAQSIVTVIRSRAAADPEFAALVERNDRNGNGVPDDNLGRIYDALLSSPARAGALSYLTEDRRSARVVYSVKASATQSEITDDARAVAEEYRYAATATGSTVVFQAISDLILESAVESLAIALSGTLLLLIGIYWLLEGHPTLGIANAVPIVVTVALIAGTMRLAGIAFNAFTATILAITIGLGIDYSVHVTHRFIDEYHERAAAVPALRRTVIGTGGALTGSMLTTVSGIGVLVLAVFPAIGQFGVLTALSVFYSYLASLLVLPSVLVLWARLERRSAGDVLKAPGTPAQWSGYGDSTVGQNR